MSTSCPTFFADQFLNKKRRFVNVPAGKQYGHYHENGNDSKTTKEQNSTGHVTPGRI